MKGSYHQFSPSELYAGIHDTDTLEADQFIGFRASGCTFLDAFVGNLHQHGLRSASVHAGLLGISPKQLCAVIPVLTGWSYINFTEEFILLMTRDLLKSNKKDLRVIAKRLGFASYSGFFRFVMRKMKVNPSLV